MSLFRSGEIKQGVSLVQAMQVGCVGVGWQVHGWRSVTAVDLGCCGSVVSSGMDGRILVHRYVGGCGCGGCFGCMWGVL